jgi:hypothetical protein
MSYNSRTGNLSAGQRSAVGNVYTGNYAYGARGGSVNTRTGGSVSGGRVNQGGVARVGDDVYAGKDGNVYKRNGDGSWDQHQPTGSWDRVQDGARTGTLDAQQSARSSGATRTQGYDAARTSGYGQGYRSGGGYGGGGMRGGGGRRR